MSKTAMLLGMVLVLAATPSFAEDTKTKSQVPAVASTVQPVKVKLVDRDMSGEQYSAYLQKRFSLATAQPVATR